MNEVQCLGSHSDAGSLLSALSERLVSLPEGISAQARIIDDSSELALAQLGRDLVPPSLSGRVVAKRRHEFYAGRWCASHALFALSGRHYSVGVADNRAPIWPAGFCGSISHSHGLALAAVASKQDFASLGVDLEYISDVPGDAQWREQIVLPEELALVQAQLSDVALAAIFSAKETLFKALNPLCGCFFEFLDARLVACDGQDLVLELCRDLSAQLRAGQRFSVQFYLVKPFILTFLYISA